MATLGQPWVEPVQVGDGGRPGPRSAPSVAAGPAPPSVVALPPIPSTIERTPASSAARIRSPVPADVAAIASRSDARRRATARTPSAISIDGPAAVVRSEPAGRGSGGRAGRATVASCHVPAAGGRDGLERPLAAVRERAEQDRVVRPGARPAVGECPGDLDRGQRPLERIGRDEDGQARPINRVGAAGWPPLARARGRPAPARRRAGGARGIRGSGSSAGAPGRPAR